MYNYYGISGSRRVTATWGTPRRVSPLPLFDPGDSSCGGVDLDGPFAFGRPAGHLSPAGLRALPVDSLTPQKGRILSPARARHVAAAAAMVPATAPLSEEPACNNFGFSWLSVVAFDGAGARTGLQLSRGTPWILTVPLVRSGGGSSLFSGLAESMSEPIPLCVNLCDRNHFAAAGDALPFTIMYAYAAFHAPYCTRTSPLGSASIACGAATLAALLLVGIIHSFRDGGSSAAIFSIGRPGMSLASAAPTWWLLATLVLFV